MVQKYNWIKRNQQFTWLESFNQMEELNDFELISRMLGKNKAIIFENT